jgi:hypothetical protein
MPRSYEQVALGLRISILQTSQLKTLTDRRINSKQMVQMDMALRAISYPRNFLKDAQAKSALQPTSLEHHRYVLSHVPYPQSLVG